MSGAQPSAAHGALALGLLCSVPAAVPGFVRVAGSSSAAIAALVLVASVSLVVVPTGAWLRRVAQSGAARGDRALAAGAALSALPLALFGGVLKSTTHHRPLGGATFAVAALCLLALCVALSFRVYRGGSESAVNSTWQNLFSLGCGLSLAGTAALGLAGAARPSLVEAAALAGAVAVTALAPVPARLARVGWQVWGAGWVILLACAMASLRSAPVSSTLGSRAPVSFASLSWLGDGS
ncbi:MAG: hypothetical protein EOO73_32950 [Myxococcales bacterium]|nr:MAG: hypothetical protein EOO73_32950 [Myxococcales bacterium]